MIHSGDGSECRGEVLDLFPFPLQQWFDITRPISRRDADTAEQQMMLYALKDGEDPESVGAKMQYSSMRNAVKRHNRKFKKKD